jgi:predicted DCC family thiol-disulfide oxidoreductase YuxK/nucleoside-diphosphate-sugar epimerase
MKKVSIFGCGWVGKALLQELKATHRVNCSVQREVSFNALKAENKFLLSTNSLFDENFYDADTMVIAIPPRGEYLQTLTTILSYVSSSTQLILLSSTSVYTQTKGVVKEEATQNIQEPTLMLQAERLVRTIRDDVVVLRLGGLMGYDRVAGKYTAGKTKAYDALVNYIYRDDVVAVIKLCMEHNTRAEVFNVVAPLHPKQSEVYAQNAEDFGWEESCFDSHEVRGKVVSSEKLVAYFDYLFLEKNPMEFWKSHKKLYQKNIILFDGVCNLCSFSVQFIIEHDSSAYFHFVSVQSTLGEKLIKKYSLEHVDSLILIEKSHAYIYSSAVLHIAKSLSSWHRHLYIFHYLPRWLRDGLYRLVAKFRYNVFGKKERCMMPTPNIKSRFL